MKLNAGSGRDYRIGWINVDIDPMWQPDFVSDLSAKYFDLPFKGEYDEIFAGDLIEHVDELVTLMTNFLALLKIGGKLVIHVPYDLSYGAWQDPTHVRAFNERSWLYYTDWFWYLGWTDHRFKLENIFYEYSSLGSELSVNGKTLEQILLTPRAIDAMKVTLVKEVITAEQLKESLKWITRKNTQ